MREGGSGSEQRARDEAAAATRERILFAAMPLFLEKGYNATSVAEILSEAGAHSGSLYHFFATEQDLLVAVLDEYHAGIEPMLLRPSWEGVDDPIERIFALMDGYRRRLIASGYRRSCPIGNVALELHEPDPPVRRRLVDNFEQWVDAVERCIREAADRLPGDLEPRPLARFVLTTMEGAVMLGRAYESSAPFDDAIDRLRDYFDRLEAAAG